MTLKQLCQFLDHLFAFRMTISVTNIEIGYGTCVLLSIAVLWLVFSFM